MGSLDFKPSVTRSPAANSLRLKGTSRLPSVLLAPSPSYSRLGPVSLEYFKPSSSNLCLFAFHHSSEWHVLLHASSNVANTRGSLQMSTCGSPATTETWIFETLGLRRSGGPVLDAASWPPRLYRPLRTAMWATRWSIDMSTESSSSVDIVLKVTDCSGCLLTWARTNCLKVDAACVACVAVKLASTCRLTSLPSVRPEACAVDSAVRAARYSDCGISATNVQHPRQNTR